MSENYAPLRVSAPTDQDLPKWQSGHLLLDGIRPYPNRVASLGECIVDVLLIIDEAEPDKHDIACSIRHETWRIWAKKANLQGISRELRRFARKS